MCTLSVVAGDNGYLLAMNRDERIARGAGEPPEIRQRDGTAAIYPRDGAGGTWISVNDYGITLALLNRNDIARPALDGAKVLSRGQIIPAFTGASSLAVIQTAFRAFSLEQTQPFRLVGVFPAEGAIGEWIWDSSQLMFQTQGWDSRHWFSSSLSDKQAERLRGTACQYAQREKDAGSVPWLRRLHALHPEGAGPFSLCVHRDDVKTLSYSEVMVTPGGVEMSHFRGSPCAMGSIHSIEIERHDCPDLRA